ncbi:MAG: RagB/SusD family nutrient uptake outer membrane protein [Bacteroidales bacterium]
MKTYKIILLLLLVAIWISCDNDTYFELERPNQYPWTKVTELEMGVREPYRLLNGNAWGSPLGAMGLRFYGESDIAQLLPDISGDSYYNEYYNRLYKTTIPSMDKEMGNAFAYLYNMVAAANAPLTMLEKAEEAQKDPFADMTAADREMVKRYKGELLFMRGVAYWYLARMFAPPFDPNGANDGKYFVLRRTFTNSATEIKHAPLATVKEVWESIQKDFEDAKKLLPINYVTSEKDGKGRANKYAASAFLSRVYFITGQFSKAKDECDFVVEGGMYNLNSDPIESFNRIAENGSCADIIWTQAMDANTSGFDRNPTIMGKNAYQGSATGGRLPNFSLCAWCNLALSYSTLKQIGWMVDGQNGDYTVGPEADGDKRYSQLYYRLEEWKSNGVVGVNDSRNVVTKPYVWNDKFFRNPGQGRRSSRPMLRYAEVLLTRATLRLKDGDKEGAVSDVNEVRRRAGLPPLDSVTLTEEQIERERIIELAGEHGDRIYYLIAMRRSIGRGDRPNSIATIEPPYSDYYWQVPLAESEQNGAYN